MFLQRGAPFNPSLSNDMKILTVDNDRDSGALYTALFERHSVTVIAAESIKEALDLLNQFVPDVLICEARFLGESVDPLIQQVRSIAQDSHKLIPIFVTSTCPAIDLSKHVNTTVDAYQIKPLDLDQFVSKVWNLIRLSKITQPLTIPAWLARLEIGKTPCCYVGVE
jgi:response regulator RpfG family c-di-GMP phosphodiesterase